MQLEDAINESVRQLSSLTSRRGLLAKVSVRITKTFQPLMSRPPSLGSAVVVTACRYTLLCASHTILEHGQDNLRSSVVAKSGCKYDAQHQQLDSDGQR